MTDKEKIRTRIEELRKVTPFTTALTESKAENWVAGREFALVSIEVFLDSLPEKQVWHKGDEEPRDNAKVILCQVCDKTRSVFTMEYHSNEKNFHVISPLGNDYVVGLDYPQIRWAYPEDLLPIK